MSYASIKENEAVRHIEQQEAAAIQHEKDVDHEAGRLLKKFKQDPDAWAQAYFDDSHRDLLDIYAFAAHSSEDPMLIGRLVLSMFEDAIRSAAEINVDNARKVML